MKKHIPFLTFLFLNCLFFSCKTPMNSFNKNSFSEGSRFIEYTDTFQVALNKLLNSHENKITIEMNEKYRDHSIDLRLDNDSLTYIGLIKGINDIGIGA